MMTLSQSAIEYIKTMVAKNNSQGFRVSIKKTGCSGYSYLPSLVEQVNVNDVALQIDGIDLYMDRAWLDLLENIHIDYVEDTKTGLKQKKLIFTNPKETSRCGCGESFHVENL